MSPWIFLLISLVLIVLCGVFVAAEIALITVDRATVEKAADGGDARAAKVLGAVKSLSTQLSGAQLGITITNLAIGFLAEPAISELIGGPLEAVGVPASFVPSLATLLGLLIATAATMVFGEMVPKNLAISQPLGAARAVITIQTLFTSLTSGFIRLLNGAANAVLKLINVEPTEELASARSPAELAALVRRSAEKGTLDQGTASLVERTLAFSDRLTRDVLTPRVRVHSVNVDEPASAVVSLSRRTGFSRFPVVESGRLDDIVGIVHVKHAVALPRLDRYEVKVGDIMIEPVLVPDSLPLDPLLQTLRAEGLQMAVVFDEYGGSAGIVSIEDLIEEIVGDVTDEHDRGGPDAVGQSDGSWLVSALLRPDEVTAITGIALPSGARYETVAGLIAEMLGKVPAVNDMLDVDDVRLRVERLDGRRVDRVRLWRDGEGPVATSATGDAS